MEHSLEDLHYRIALTNISNVGSVLAKTLISYCGSAKSIFHQKKSHLLKIPGIGEGTATAIIEGADMKWVEREVEFIEKNHIRPLFFLDKEYPLRLKRIKDAPIMLYYKGTADLNIPHAVAIVGTRKPTLYGKLQCEKILEALRGREVLVISKRCS